MSEYFINGNLKRPGEKRWKARVRKNKLRKIRRDLGGISEIEFVRRMIDGYPQ